MKKRLFAAFLVTVMLGCALLTGCNQGSGVTQEEDRRPLTITLYGIKGEGTTDDAIKAVQKGLNEVTKAYFSTQLILRLYTEEEYNDVIDNLVADIALKEEEAANAAAASDSAAKESKRVAGIDKLIAADKAEVTTRSRWVKNETEEVTTEETYDTELNILNEAVEAYPTADATQVDIFLICGTANLNKYVTDETYATDGESFLVALDEELKFSAKSLNQYINPTVLQAGKVNNKTYAIPTNKRIADEATYLVLDKALLKEMNVDSDSIKTLTSKSLVTYMQAIVDTYNSDDDKTNDIVPMLSQPGAPGIVGLFDEDTIFGTYVANTAVTGFKSAPKNLLSAYQYTDYYIAMQQFKRNGYLWDTVPEGTKWASAVVTGDEDAIAQYDTDHYVVKVLEKAMATSESAGSYMYGISKYTKDSSRCMEIITYLNTNAEFRNMFQYGIEGSNYKIDVDTGKLVRINNDYMMDIQMTGNMFIAYPEEGMDLDVWEKAKAANLETIVSPYMGFLFETKDNGDLIESVKKLSEQIKAELAAYDIDADYQAQFDALKAQAAKYEANTNASDKEEFSLSVALAAVNAMKSYLTDAIAAVDAANTALEAPKAELAAAQAAMKPFTAAVKSAEIKAKAKQQEIDELKAAIEAAENPPETSAETGETAAVVTEAELAKMKEQLPVLEAELVVLNEELRAAEGRVYDYQKVVDAKQAVYNEYEAKVTAAEDARDRIMYAKTTTNAGETVIAHYVLNTEKKVISVIDIADGYQIKNGDDGYPAAITNAAGETVVDLTGSENTQSVMTTYSARLTVYESLLKKYNALIAEIDGMTIPDEGTLAAEYAEMQAQLSELQAKLDAAVAEASRYEAVTEKDADGNTVIKSKGDLYDLYTAAKAAVNAANAALNGKAATTTEEAVIGAIPALEALQKENEGYDKAVMIAYIDLKEAEDAAAELQNSIDEANKTLAEKRAALTALDTTATDYQTKADALQKEIDTQTANITKYTADKAEADKKVAALTDAYNKSMTDDYKAVKAKIDAAEAAVAAAQAAYDAAAANETYLAYDAATAVVKDYTSQIKALTTSISNFSTRTYTYRDDIYKTLYTAYFKKLVAECEANADYAVFMNIGEDNADNEKGVIYIYNEWYSSMYGS